jgi:hypothetical protein
MRGAIGKNTTCSAWMRSTISSGSVTGLSRIQSPPPKQA